MLDQHTIEKLHCMRLGAKPRGLHPTTSKLQHGRVLVPRAVWPHAGSSLELEREQTLKRLLSEAKPKVQACPEDIDYQTPRGLDKGLILELCSAGWIRNHQNALITGPTGVGKTYLACALANRACRDGFRVLYSRAPRLYHDLSVARADGT